MKLGQYIVSFFALWQFVPVNFALASDVPLSLTTAAQSVVQIRVNASDLTKVSGTGFVWKDKSYVVTTLHLVIGVPEITVWFESLRKEASARVYKKLERSDLALLKIEDAPEVAPLKVANETISPDEKLTVLGYPLGIPSISSTEGKVRAIGGAHLKDIIPYSVRTEIEDFGFPDVNSPIVNLEASLVPGHSGAPVLLSSGEVVAIGDGGLERGSGSMSWAIPVSELDDLFSAEPLTENTLFQTKRNKIRELYGAELNAKVGQTVTSGHNKLTKIRTRTFAELISHVDDGLGLNQLLQVLHLQRADIDPNQFQYDIYQDAESGATIVVPAGFKLEVSGDHFVVNRSGNGLKMLVRLYKGSTYFDAVRASNEFQTLLLDEDRSVQWFNDPAWSQVMPVYHVEGFYIRRTSWYGNQFNGFGWTATHYAFATVGVRNNVMLGAITVNNRFADRLQSTDWVQMHLGIQFTTFSQTSLSTSDSQ